MCARDQGGRHGLAPRDTAGIEPLPEFAAVQLADQSDLSWLEVRLVDPDGQVVTRLPHPDPARDHPRTVTSRCGARLSRR